MTSLDTNNLPSSMTNKDLFKLCIMHPKYTKNMSQPPQDNPYQIQQQDANNKDNIKEKMKVFMKVWSGMTKYLRSQGEKGRCVDLPLVGRFMKRVGGDTERYFFVPHIDFCESGKFQFPENDSNISPLSKLLPVKTSIINLYRTYQVQYQCQQVLQQQYAMSTEMQSCLSSKKYSSDL